MTEIIYLAVTNYMHGREAHINDFSVPADVEESEIIDKYNIPEPHQHHISEADDGADEEIAAEELVESFPSDSSFQDQPAPVEEPVGEPTKHTYASIVCHVFKHTLSLSLLANSILLEFFF